MRIGIYYVGLVTAVVILVGLVFHYVLGFGALTIAGVIGGVITLLVVDSLTGGLPKSEELDQAENSETRTLAHPRHRSEPPQEG